ncbi:MAG: hypothetical protein Q4F27_04780 [Desulfovibrionaceae bacterium]|nr:hypothetical protein [Desulfovibrionaceae bacterium]
MQPTVHSTTPLRVIVSLDVEEEGLFSGRYASTNCSVGNVSLLPRLAPLTQELGFPLTLFCAHSVFADAEARRTLAWMRDHCGAEIAAHLHHWSTPPLTDEPSGGPPVRTHLLPAGILRSRLATLLDAGKDFQSAPLTSFRMGRWDLKASLLPLLAEAGITLDSSICPLRAFNGGADHFLAPADPYWPGQIPEQTVLEAPITQIPLHPALARLWYRMTERKLPLRDNFHFWGTLSANPVWHNACVMRMVSRMHFGRGGKVLSLFWHSSEMLPGASPHVPNQAAADALLHKIFAFLRWLKEHFPVKGVTAAELRAEAAMLGFAARPSGQGDW